MLSLPHIERVSMENGIKFISTPTTCKECDHYDAKAKKCKLKVCRYPARRRSGFGLNGGVIKWLHG